MNNGGLRLTHKSTRRLLFAASRYPVSRGLIIARRLSEIYCLLLEYRLRFLEPVIEYLLRSEPLSENIGGFTWMIKKCANFFAFFSW